MVLEASLRARLAFCSPSAAITWEWMYFAKCHSFWPKKLSPWPSLLWPPLPLPPWLSGAELGVEHLCWNYNEVSLVIVPCFNDQCNYCLSMRPLVQSESSCWIVWNWDENKCLHFDSFNFNSPGIGGLIWNIGFKSESPSHRLITFSYPGSAPSSLQSSPSQIKCPPDI